MVTPSLRLLVTDADGVLSDGGLYYMSSRSSAITDVAQKFSTYDGEAMRLIEDQCGLDIVILSSNRFWPLMFRAHDLDVDLIIEPGDKWSRLKTLMYEKKVLPEQVVYVGDSYNDLECITNIHYSFCPLNAIDPVKENVYSVLNRSGGEGVLLELYESFLKKL